MKIVSRIEGEGADLFAAAAKVLGSESKASAAYRMAINQAGRDARVATIRALSKQVGMTRKDIIAHGGITEIKASSKSLEWTMKSSGRPLPLKLFGAKQFRFGVRARPWGKAQRFPGAFIFAGTWRSRQPVKDGHVLHRVGAKITTDDGDKFQPYSIMYGPAIPVEMVKDESAKAFEEAAAKLPMHVEKIIAKMTEGVIG